MTDRRAAQASYAVTALERAAHDVATTGSGRRNAQLNRAALEMGHYVGAGAISAEQAEPPLIAAALRAGLRAAEARSTISSGLRAGMKSPAFQRDRERSGASPRPRPVPIALPPEPVDPTVEQDFQAFVASILELCPVGGDVAAYLESRGLPVDVPDVFGLPPVGEQPALTAELAARHGRAALDASGMFDAELRLQWREHRVGFVWRDAVTSQATTVQRRYPGNPPGEASKIVFARGRSPTWPFGSHLVRDLPSGEPIAIVEGPIDWLAWRTLHPNVDAARAVALPSATALQLKWVPMFMGRTVFICLDADAAGEGASSRIIEQLASCAAPLRIRPWPDCKDWCAYLETRPEVRQ